MRPALIVTVLAAACAAGSPAAVAPRFAGPTASAVASSPASPSPSTTAPVAPTSTASPRPTPRHTPGPRPTQTREPVRPTPSATPRPAASPTRSTTPKTVALAMKTGNAFSPRTLTIDAGDTVTVTNQDLQRHNWTDASVFASGDLPPAASYSFRFTRAGSYSYECTIHAPGMAGTITVR